MARTKRPVINMNNKASCRLVRETLIEFNPEVEDMVSIRSKIKELLKMNNLKVNSNKRRNHLNGLRLIRFYENNSDKLPTLKQLQPYETVIKGYTIDPSKSLYLQDTEYFSREEEQYVEPAMKKRHIEIIDLTLDD
jgi:hypothetical protein